MSAGRVTLAILAGLLIAAVVMTVANVGSSIVAADDRQEQLQPFYTPPGQLPGPPGTLIRFEPLGVDVAGGTGYRILYVSERPDGEPAVSGGMVFVPDAPAPQGGRPIVSWAHGTIGQGDACAPSRSKNPLQDTDGWLQEMMQRGWLVVSTDYTGLGTPGPNLYLVGEAEARDVVHAVQAARQFPDSEASNRFVAWGHSQGGHSVLWTSHLSESIAPELELVAVAAAAPAAELAMIMGAQWDTAAGWAIGPEVIDSWPVVDPSLPLDGFLSPEGRSNAERLAQECIIPAALEGMVRSDFREDFFSVDPLSSPQWQQVADSQTPEAIIDRPILIGQSTADTVVLPWPNAALQEKWCSAGSDLTMMWLGKVSHQDTAMVMGPSAVSWIDQRFAGEPTDPTCDIPPPVTASP